MTVLMLHCTADLYGSSRILLYVAEIMRKKGHRVLVVLPEDGLLVAEMQKLGATVQVINLGILRRKYFTPWGLTGRIFLWMMATTRLCKMVWSEKVELIYSNTSGAIVGAFVAAITQKKHYWHIHEIIEKPRILVKTIGWLTGTANKIILVSQAVVNAWAPHVDTKKILLLHNGIDNHKIHAVDSTLRAELGITGDAVVIGMIGRVLYWKGQTYFLEIAGHLAAKYPNARFVMVGDAFPGYEYIYNDMQNAIEKYHLQTVTFNLGYRSDINNILSGLDIFISPSTLPDPFPTVVLEAMACGKPVAATRHGGVTEMLTDQETGIFLPLADAQKAAELLYPLMDDSQRKVKMGQNAFQRQREQFSIAQFERQIIELL